MIIIIIAIMVIITHPGQAAKVLFHVTVMSLDSIDEGSMVRKQKTAFQYNHSFGFQKPMKVKVVK